MRQEVKADQQEWRNQLALVRADHQELRIIVLEAQEARPARPIIGVSPQRLEQLYALAHRVRQRYGHRIDETLRGLADRFRVEDVYDLPEKDWPAALEWLSTMLED